jgi:NAD(P)-dependent dehydrogenase (short-subunit alcohol dehydrogenase family)
MERRLVQPPIDLDGRRVVVTGGAAGIGRAACLYLAGAGARLAVLDRDLANGGQTAAAITAAGGVATFISVDVADEASVARALGEAAVWLGGLDGVINCAGIMKGSHLEIERMTPEIWSQVLAINLTGSFHVAKHAASHMIPNHAGVIVLIGSKAGVAGGSGSFAYGASKGGVHGLAMALDRTLVADGIRVYEVCPGSMETSLRRASIEEGMANGADAEWFGGAVGAPEGVAAVLAFLLTDGAGYLPMTIVVEERRAT